MSMRHVVAGLCFSLTTASAVLAQGLPSADHDWLGDGRRFRVGDVITVLIDEWTTATADRSTTAFEDRETGAGASGAVNGRGGDGNLGTFLESRSVRRGRDIRQDRLAAEISVRVVAMEDDGALRVEGTKLVLVDRHEQRVTVSGLVRPQDVDASNVIESWRLAEAQIRYEANGRLGQADKSIFTRFLGWIF